jgi:hypothetical protein
MLPKSEPGDQGRAGATQKRPVAMLVADIADTSRADLNGVGSVGCVLFGQSAWHPRRLGHAR